MAGYSLLDIETGAWINNHTTTNIFMNGQIIQTQEQKSLYDVEDWLKEY